MKEKLKMLVVMMVLLALVFALPVLAEGQEAAAKACGFESGRKTDKSKRVQTHLMAPGLPVLGGAAAAMVCRVRQVVKYSGWRSLPQALQPRNTASSTTSMAALSSDSHIRAMRHSRSRHCSTPCQYSWSFTLLPPFLPIRPSGAPLCPGAYKIF